MESTVTVVREQKHSQSEIISKDIDKQLQLKRHRVVTRGELVFMMLTASSLRDGNCMFYAVALCLNDLGKGDYDHETVRRETVVHLTINPNTPDGIPRWNFIDRDRYPSWNKYLNAMSKDGEWGDHVCLEAILELYQVNIHILDTRGLQYDRILGTDSPSPTIYLQFENECHYEALTKVDNMVSPPYDGQSHKETTSDGIGNKTTGTCRNKPSGPYDELWRELQAITKATNFKASGPYYRYVLQSLLYYVSLLQHTYNSADGDARKCIIKQVALLFTLKLSIEEFHSELKTWLQIRRQTFDDLASLPVILREEVQTSSDTHGIAAATSVCNAWNFCVAFFALGVVSPVGVVPAGVAFGIRMAAQAYVSYKESQARKTFDKARDRYKNVSSKLEAKLTEITQLSITIKELHDVMKQKFSCSQYAGMLAESRLIISETYNFLPTRVNSDRNTTANNTDSVSVKAEEILELIRLMDLHTEIITELYGLVKIGNVNLDSIYFVEEGVDCQPNGDAEDYVVIVSLFDMLMKQRTTLTCQLVGVRKTKPFELMHDDRIAVDTEETIKAIEQKLNLLEQQKQVLDTSKEVFELKTKQNALETQLNTAISALTTRLESETHRREEAENALKSRITQESTIIADKIREVEQQRTVIELTAKVIQQPDTVHRGHLAKHQQNRWKSLDQSEDYLAEEINRGVITNHLLASDILTSSQHQRLLQYQYDVDANKYLLQLIRTEPPEYLEGLKAALVAAGDDQVRLLDYLP